FSFMRTEPPELYTLSLHDALPISPTEGADGRVPRERRASTARDARQVPAVTSMADPMRSEEVTLKDRRRVVIRPSRLSDAESLLDRKSTRLNSSHVSISYAVFCLK